MVASLVRHVIETLVRAQMMVLANYATIDPVIPEALDVLVISSALVLIAVAGWTFEWENKAHSHQQTTEASDLSLSKVPESYTVTEFPFYRPKRPSTYSPVGLYLPQPEPGTGER